MGWWLHSAHRGLRRHLAAWGPAADLVQRPLPLQVDFPSLQTATRGRRRPTRAHRAPALPAPSPPSGSAGLEPGGWDPAVGCAATTLRPPRWRQGSKCPRLGHEGHRARPDPPGWRVEGGDGNFQFPAGRRETRRRGQVETPPPLRPEAAGRGEQRFSARPSVSINQAAGRLLISSGRKE